MDMPDSPFSEIGIASITLHQNFMEIMKAGFTRDEALQVFLVILNNQMASS